jgi:hypothetical protein
MNKDIYLLLIICLILFIYAPFILSVVLVLYIIKSLDN